MREGRCCFVLGEARGRGGGGHGRSVVHSRCALYRDVCAYTLSLHAVASSPAIYALKLWCRLSDHQPPARTPPRKKKKWAGKQIIWTDRAFLFCAHSLVAEFLFFFLLLPLSPSNFGRSGSPTTRKKHTRRRRKHLSFHHVYDGQRRALRPSGWGNRGERRAREARFLRRRHGNLRPRQVHPGTQGDGQDPHVHGEWAAAIEPSIVNASSPSRLGLLTCMKRKTRTAVCVAFFGALSRVHAFSSWARVLLSSFFLVTPTHPRFKGWGGEGGGGNKKTDSSPSPNITNANDDNRVGETT